MKSEDIKESISMNKKEVRLKLQYMNLPSDIMLNFIELKKVLWI
jgi:hypothetical protein